MSTLPRCRRDHVPPCPAPPAAASPSPLVRQVLRTGAHAAPSAYVWWCSPAVLCEGTLADIVRAAAEWYFAEGHDALAEATVRLNWPMLYHDLEETAASAQTASRTLRKKLQEDLGASEDFLHMLADVVGRDDVRHAANAAIVIEKALGEMLRQAAAPVDTLWAALRPTTSAAELAELVRYAQGEGSLLDLGELLQEAVATFPARILVEAASGEAPDTAAQMALSAFARSARRYLPPDAERAPAAKETLRAEIRKLTRDAPTFHAHLRRAAQRELVVSLLREAILALPLGVLRQQLGTKRRLAGVLDAYLRMPSGELARSSVHDALRSEDGSVENLRHRVGGLLRPLSESDLLGSVLQAAAERAGLDLLTAAAAPETLSHDARPLTEPVRLPRTLRDEMRALVRPHAGEAGALFSPAMVEAFFADWGLQITKPLATKVFESYRTPLEQAQRFGNMALTRPGEAHHDDLNGLQPYGFEEERVRDIHPHNLIITLPHAARPLLAAGPMAAPAILTPAESRELLALNAEHAEAADAAAGAATGAATPASPAGHQPPSPPVSEAETEPQAAEVSAQPAQTMAEVPVPQAAGTQAEVREAETGRQNRAIAAMAALLQLQEGTKAAVTQAALAGAGAGTPASTAGAGRQPPSPPAAKVETALPGAEDVAPPAQTMPEEPVPQAAAREAETGRKDRAMAALLQLQEGTRAITAARAEEAAKAARAEEAAQAARAEEAAQAARAEAEAQAARAEAEAQAARAAAAAQAAREVEDDELRTAIANSLRSAQEEAPNRSGSPRVLRGPQHDTNSCFMTALFAAVFSNPAFPWLPNSRRHLKVVQQLAALFGVMAPADTVEFRTKIAELLNILRRKEMGGTVDRMTCGDMEYLVDVADSIFAALHLGVGYQIYKDTVGSAVTWFSNTKIRVQLNMPHVTDIQAIVSGYTVVDRPDHSETHYFWGHVHDDAAGLVLLLDRSMDSANPDLTINESITVRCSREEPLKATPERDRDYPKLLEEAPEDPARVLDLQSAVLMTSAHFIALLRHDGAWWCYDDIRPEGDRGAFQKIRTAGPAMPALAAFVAEHYNIELSQRTCLVAYADLGRGRAGGTA